MPKPMQRKTNTREYLQKALLELMQEKEYSEITIQAITERADTARVTFYRNYKDKEELLLDSLEYIYALLLEQFETMNNRELVQGTLESSPMMPLFKHIAEHRTMYQAILGGQVAAIVHKQLLEYASDFIGKNLQRLLPETSPLPIEVLAVHIAVAQLGMIQWWLANDTPYDYVYLAKQSYQLTLRGVQHIIAAEETD